MEFYLSETSGEALYLQIKRALKKAILAGEVRGSEVLPSIRELARGHAVSVITVQKAYEELLNEGLIYVRRGKGFFVTPMAQDERQKIALKSLRTSIAAAIDKGLGQGLNESMIKNLLNGMLKEI